MSITLIIDSSISIEAAAKPWFGFDFDATIAHYPPKKADGMLGKPIESEVLTLLKQLVAEGHECRIVTARVGSGTPAEIAKITKEMQAWCLTYVGKELPVTAKKDYLMIVLFDDRAIQVEYNTGKLLGDPTKIEGWPKLKNKSST